MLPFISYRVESVADLEDFNRSKGQTFGLIYSKAPIEHIWFIDKFWSVMGRLTSDDEWHSHRIDLADHDRPESNYIEMLEMVKVESLVPYAFYSKFNKLMESNTLSSRAKLLRSKK